MATAKRGTTSKPGFVEEESFTLVISRKEAELLAIMCAKTGGDPVRSARRYERDLAEAFDSAGIDWHTLQPFVSGHLECKEDNHG